MTSALEVADGEAIIVDFLSRELSVFVSTAYASNANGDPSVPMVRVNLTSVSRRNLVRDRFQISVQGLAATRAEARDLTARAHRKLLAARSSPSGIRNVSDVSGPVEFNDPDFPKLNRFQATVLASIRPVEPS